uniref:Uncharacterized protein LOC100179843 n=1 Tax=Phallusia mammillata TaxID=59560 RepID=A0A6F9DGJ7_9ASCI|nr:uncharacterized protein LOC100179843 [Phallusia mammillata]
MSMPVLNRFGLTLSTTIKLSHSLDCNFALVARRLTPCCSIHLEQNNVTHMKQRHISLCAHLSRMNPMSYVQKAKDQQDKSKEMNLFYSKLNGAISAGKGERDPKKNPVLAKLIKEHSGILRKGKLSQFLERGGKEMKEISLHLKGPSGLQIVVEASSPNSSVALLAVKTAANKANVKFEAQGVSRSFEIKGVVRVELPIDGKIPDEDDATSLAIEVGAEDVVLETNCLTFYCDKKETSNVSKALNEKGIEPMLVNIELVPVETVQLSEEIKLVFENFVEILDRIEDNSSFVFQLQRVISNME